MPNFAPKITLIDMELLTYRKKIIPEKIIEPRNRSKALTGWFPESDLLPPPALPEGNRGRFLFVAKGIFCPLGRRFFRPQPWSSTSRAGGVGGFRPAARTVSLSDMNTLYLLFLLKHSEKGVLPSPEFL